MVFLRIALVLASILALTAADLAWAQKAPPIKVGAVLRLTIGAEHGIPARRGVELAVEEVNAQGGIQGRRVELIVEDEKDKPAEAVTSVKKLIEVDKVVAMVGPMTSGGILAAGPVAEQAKIVAITPTATSPKVTGMGAYIYRSCSRIDLQSKALTEYVVQRFKPKSAAILYSNEPYGKGAADAFAQDFKRLGVKVEPVESFMRGSRDFMAQLTKIKAANPDIIFIPGYTPETAPAAAQARQLGMKQPIFGVYGDMDPVYAQLAGAAAEGHIIAGEYDEDYDTPRNRKFRERYHALVKKDPKEPFNIMFAALTYDAMSLILEGMKKYGPTPEGVKRFLDEVKEFDGVTGKLTFDPKHDVTKPGVGVYILEIKGGRYVKVK